MPPSAKFVVTKSNSRPGLPSLRPYPRDEEGPKLQELLKDAGFEIGDIVELTLVERISKFDCKGGCGRRTANTTGTCLKCQKKAKEAANGNRDE